MVHHIRINQVPGPCHESIPIDRQKPRPGTLYLSISLHSVEGAIVEETCDIVADDCICYYTGGDDFWNTLIEIDVSGHRIYQ